MLLLFMRRLKGEVALKSSTELQNLIVVSILRKEIGRKFSTETKREAAPVCSQSKKGITFRLLSLKNKIKIKNVRYVLNLPSWS